MDVLEPTEAMDFASAGPKAESLLPVITPIRKKKVLKNTLLTPKPEMNTALVTNKTVTSGKTDLPNSPVRKEPTVVAFAKTPPEKSGYRIQIAAYRDDTRAKTAWAKFKKAHIGILGPLTPLTQRVDLGKKGIYFRVQAGYFSTANAARAACAKLKAKRQDCIIIAPKLDAKG